MAVTPAPSSHPVGSQAWLRRERLPAFVADAASAEQASATIVAWQDAAPTEKYQRHEKLLTLP
jgi:hypothetical protein